jgi:hypothetical protein
VDESLANGVGCHLLLHSMFEPAQKHAVKQLMAKGEARGILTRFLIFFYSYFLSFGFNYMLI